MFCKLAFKNVRKSFQDYTIYFLTLTFAVCLFYVFNSVQSQKAMLEISASTETMMQMLETLIAFFSIFVAVVLGFLIVYANNFLVKRRKKELGLYQMLGMNRRSVSLLLMLETVFVGIIALAAGLILGVFASQGMSIVTASLFEVQLTRYVFIFSPAAAQKTLFCFGIIFLIVILFNFVTISRVKLIDLINGERQNEKPHLRNGAVTLLSFVLAVLCLAAAYFVALKFGLLAGPLLGIAILLGSIGTLLFFFSLSGFLTRLLRRNKRFYFKGLNMFVLQQINSRINTAFVSLTVICLMLFFTICTLSGGIGLANAMSASLKANTPFDASVSVPSTLLSYYFEEEDPSSAQTKTITQTLQDFGFDPASYGISSAEFTIYLDTGSTPINAFLLDGAPLTSYTEELKNAIKTYEPDSPHRHFQLLKLSDYNQILALQGKAPISLEEGQYYLLGSSSTAPTLNAYLQNGGTFSVNGQTLQPANREAADTALFTSSAASSDGTIVVPDTVTNGLPAFSLVLDMQYPAGLSESETTAVNAALEAVTGNRKAPLYGSTRESTYDSAATLRVTATYIAIYLGFTFLIAGAAILAIQQLSEASDNIARYRLLRKLGAESKLIHHALFSQIAIYFLCPLGLAGFHSIFGMQLLHKILGALGTSSALPYVFATAAFVLVIYGLYFLATYFGCRSMICEKRIR